MDQLVCYGVPLPQYIKEPRGEGGVGQEEGAGGVLLLPGVGLPPNPIPTRIPQGGKEGEGWPATSPSPNRTRGRGEARSPYGQPFHLSTKAHEGPYGSRGVPVTLPVFR